MDNYSTNKNVNQDSAESNFDLKKILKVCLRNWYWFVISVVLCCGFAVYKIMSTQPQYSRTAILLIKESNVRRTSSSEVESMLAQAGQITSKLANEMVVFQSQSLMSEAVSRLGLTVDYALKGKFRNTVVYGHTVPVNVDFSSIPDDVFVNLTIEPLQGDSVAITNASYACRGEHIKISDTEVVKIGEKIQMPFGTIQINKNPYYFSEKVWDKAELVTKRSLASATSLYSSRFTVSSQESKTRMSDVLTLSVTDYSINRADDLINMIVTVYNEKWVVENNKMAASNSVFIEERLASIEDELNKVDNTITNYKSKNKMPSVDEASRMYTSQASDIARQIRELESQLSVAKFLRNFLASSLDETTLIPVPSGLNNAAIVSQVGEYNNMLLNRNSLIAASSEKNPIVVELGENMAAMRGAIVSSVDNQVATLEEMISFASAQQSQTEERIAQNPTQALDLVKYERLQKVQETLYMYLLQKREENVLSQAFSAYNTRIVNPPYGSGKPVSPRSSRILLIAFILGLCIPAGVFTLMVTLDTKVHSKKDLEGMDFSYLGEIPLAGEHKKENIFTKFNKKENGPLSQIVVEKGNRNVINEAFRITRANLEFVCRTTNDKIMMFTSYHPGSGKTFVNLNLASALAINGKKVLIADCDFRRRTLSSFLNLKHKGFADYLTAPSAEISDFIVKDVMHPGLDVLPVGTLPPNPSELLTMEEVPSTFEALRDKYDFIFIDCPPVDIVADTQIIAPVADRTIFVVRSGLFDKSEIPEIYKMRDSGRYKNISLVLNATTNYNGGSYGSNSYYHRRNHHYYVNK